MRGDGRIGGSRYARPVRLMSAWRGAQDRSARPDGPPARWLQSIGVVVPSAIFIAGSNTFSTGVKLALVLVASAWALDLVRREARDPGSPVPIACCTAALLVIAVIFPPKFSQDLWSYAIAGRMVAFHHASPYLHPAHAFRHDPLYGLVGTEWRTGTTPYGPLFTLYSTAVALAGGSHPLLFRLAYQGGAALAIAFALAVLWRKTGSTSALALLGLHPLIACSAVNGGHNDAFVGLGVLIAVICARRERYAIAGLWIAGALLVKATAGLALLPLVGWAWTRGGRRAVVELLAAPALVAAPVMLLTPGMMHSLHTAKTNVITRTSIWNYPLQLVPQWFPPGQHTHVAHLVSLALVVVIALVVLFTVVARRDRDPAPGVVAATAAWLIFSAYVLPWYTVWALPVAALNVRNRLTRLVTIQGVAITAAFVVPRTTLGGQNLARDVVQLALPAALAAMLIWTMVPVLRRAWTDRTSPISTV